MSTSFPRYGLVFLLLLPVTACSGTAEQITGPTALADENPLRSSMAIEPQSLRAEFLPGSCIAGRPFGARFRFIIGGHHDLILRGLRFSFVDRRGATALPEVIPITSLSAPAGSAPTLPSSSPIPMPGVAPLPGASPIPMPGATPVNGIFISAGASRVLPFFARFGCGVIADGTLLIVVDAGDRGGRFHNSELRARIGS